MTERKGITKAGGSPLTLVGPELKVGDRAPDFMLAANDMKPVSLKDYAGRTLVLLGVPSLDTPVCDMETRRFNKEAAALSDKIAVLTISMDLPFAQKRWCAAAGIDRVRTLSDYRGAEFARSYGVFIKELYLLARSAFVVDRAGVIRYTEITPNVEDEPDYAGIIEAARAAL
ncbi:MAG: thiol peroxidase [Elusimicrobiaceae bacterium]|nr:thiol peroxidase [Elusimicrobiaceae bacterium]